MSSNGISPRPDFDRRRKTDLTTDSICLHCLRTVANCSDEVALATKEDQHFCWQRQAKLSRMRSRDNEAASSPDDLTPVSFCPASRSRSEAFLPRFLYHKFHESG